MALTEQQKIQRANDNWLKRKPLTEEEEKAKSKKIRKINQMLNVAALYPSNVSKRFDVMRG